MKNVFLSFAFLLFFITQFQAQTVVNGDFSTNSCTDFRAGCVNNWTQSHGDPTLMTTPSDHAWMWSYKSLGEGIYTAYNFEAGQCYEVSFKMQTSDRGTNDPNVANHARVNVLAANGVSPRSFLSYSPVTASSSEAIFSDLMGPYLENDPTEPWTDITLTYTPGSNFSQLWIYPFMTQNSSNGSQAELRIDDIVITPTEISSDFHFENEKGTEVNEFACGQDIYLDGSASVSVNNYFIDAWRRPTGSTGSFQYYAGIGWNPGQVGTHNLSQLFANQGVTFEPGYEYQIKLAVQNLPCYGWVPSLQTFTVVSATYNTDFALSLSSDFSGNLTVSTLANSNPVPVYHQFQVYYAGPNGEVWPYNTLVPGHSPVCCSDMATFSGNGLVVNEWYYIKHGVWNECASWAETRKPFIIRTKRSKTGRPSYYIEYKETTKFALTDNYLQEMSKAAEELKAQTENAAINGTKTPVLSETKRMIPSVSEVQLFPNPAKSDQTITISAEEAITSVELMDVSGRMLEINVEGLGEPNLKFTPSNKLNSGLYVVTVKTADEMVSVRKLMVQ